MHDQYGNLAPDDLVALDVPISTFTVRELKAIDRLDWYQSKRGSLDSPILVSRAALRAALDWAPLSLRRVRSNVVRIDRVLHRYSDADGFYHA